MVLLVKAAQAWKAQHGGALPSTSKERSAFKELITDFKRKADELPIDVRARTSHAACFLLLTLGHGVREPPQGKAQDTE